MSIHVIENEKVRWTFGWKQRYHSFFLAKHDKTINATEPVINLGNTSREIPDEESLFTLAMMAGLDIPKTFQDKLYKDKRAEGNIDFVLHWPKEFTAGFHTDSLAHAEILREGLAPARPDEELQIRWVQGHHRPIEEGE